MNALPLRSAERNAIHVAIDAHGPGRVLIAALVAMLRPRARPPDGRALPAHLKRDLGLPAAPPALPSERIDPLLFGSAPFRDLR
ncbi:hypothetical protein [Jannaschia formosa]|uniref:hypothetical protein n=1 Tax=Jannaschia formosa TaxID=2259592 RepID=UPI000E1C0480|nr:hypothetical protein [Jannaschia formosa]TFL17379.1 hypothetical protein DR046_15410 [Jannaschia formosa]